MYTEDEIREMAELFMGGEFTLDLQEIKVYAPQLLTLVKNRPGTQMRDYLGRMSDKIYQSIYMHDKYYHLIAIGNTDVNAPPVFSLASGAKVKIVADSDIEAILV